MIAEVCNRLAALVLKSESEPKHKQEQKEPLLELLVVEGLDTLIRLGLMVIVPRILGDRRAGLMWGSYIGDVIFAVILHKKRDLLRVVCLSGRACYGYCTQVHQGSLRMVKGCLPASENHFSFLAPDFALV